MASILSNINCSSVVGPWYIEPNDVLGDSLQYINNNTMYFTCLIDSLYSQLNSSYIQKLAAGDGIVLTPINDAYNTIKISAFRTVPQVYVYDTISQNVSSVVAQTPLAAPPWWCDVNNILLTEPYNLKRVQVYTSSISWQVPLGVTNIKVTIVGGGGGGGGHAYNGQTGTEARVGTGGGGGSGGVNVISNLAVTPGQRFTIVVGGGGGGGAQAIANPNGNSNSNGRGGTATGGNGGDGKQSSFNGVVAGGGGRGSGGKITDAGQKLLYAINPQLFAAAYGFSYSKYKPSVGTQEGGARGTAGSPGGKPGGNGSAGGVAGNGTGGSGGAGYKFNGVEYGAGGDGAGGGPESGGGTGQTGGNGAVIIEVLNSIPEHISQQITLSAQFTQYLQSVVAANTAVPMPNTYSIVNLGNLGFTPEDKLSWGEGSVMLPTGDIFIINSYNEGHCYTYNPNSNTIRQIPTTPKTINSGGACIMSDGRVFINATGPGATIFNPLYETFTTAGGVDWTNREAYWSYNCCMLPNGNVYQNPTISDLTAIIYDPVNDVTTTSTNAPSGYAHTCVPMRDGRVFRIPGTVGGPSKGRFHGTKAGNKAYIYNPYTNAFEIAGGVFPTTSSGNGWFSGCLLADGRVFMAPNSTSYGPLIYNPYTNQLEDGGGTTGWILNDTYEDVGRGVINYAQSILLPNGNVLCVPGSVGGTPKGIIYNPYTKSVVKQIPQLGLAAGTGGAHLCQNGNIIIVPWYKQPIRNLRIPFVQNFDNNTLTSPFFHHGGY